MAVDKREATKKADQDGKKKGDGKDKPQAKLWHMTIAAIGLIFYMSWLGMKFFGPPQEFTNQKTRDDTALTAKVSPQAGPEGDLSKVNPVDRAAFLNMM